MKLLQNDAGNFFNMTPTEAITLAAKLLKAAEDASREPDGSASGSSRRGAGFVQTIILQEHRLHSFCRDMERLMCPQEMDRDDRYYGEMDTIFVGISPTHIDVHPDLEAGIKPRSPHTMNIDPNDINVRLKRDGSSLSGAAMRIG